MNLQFPVDSNYKSYHQFQLIKCREHKTILIAWTSSQTQYAALIIHRIRISESLRPLREIIQQIGPFPSYQDCKQEIITLIGTFQERQTIYACGIVGFHKFLQGYYLMYIKESDVIAKIGKHEIHQVRETEVLQLFETRNDLTKKQESGYLDRLNEFKLQNFYYSQTYDLTNSLAKNMVRNSKVFYGIQKKEEARNQDKGIPNCRTEESVDVHGMCGLFHYNKKILLEFEGLLRSKKWLIGIVHGFCKQINTKFQGSYFNVIVIGRRSQYHAGTRYIKRGLSSEGFPANYVEIEQIVINHSSSHHTKPICSSHLQIRASVPTYWMQRPSIAIPQPAIEIRKDDYMFLGTRKHFADLVKKYGRRIYCINLMRMKQKTPRQSGLSYEYSNAVQFINKNDIPEEQAIHYIELDMKYNLKLDKKLFIDKAKTLGYFTVLKTGIFLCNTYENTFEFQNGIVRTNCVDCLDRTNSFQQLIGQTVLSYQLLRLLKKEIKYQYLELQQNLSDEYSVLYEEMGDLLSIQYGSSLAHKQKIQKSAESRFEFLTSITRHVNNNFKDQDRQKQIDIFLGFQPDINGAQIWQIKPVIEHYPSKKLQKYQNQRWYEKACDLFEKSFDLQQFQKIQSEIISKGRAQESTQNNLLGLSLPKEKLMAKFSAEIVGKLINEKQSNKFYRFNIIPKVTLAKDVWAKLNPSNRQIKGLSEEINFYYNRKDFQITEEQKQLLQMSPEKKKILSSIGKVNRNALLFFEENNEFIRDIDRYLTADMLDIQEIKLLEQYLEGNNKVGGCETEKYVLEDAIITQREIEEEIISTEARIIRGQFIDYQPIQRKANDLNRSLKIVESKKKETFKDNKVKILENILLKNFSHGQTTSITQI